jgi:hypothetical protein
MKKNINALFLSNNLSEIVDQYSELEVANELNFKESIKLAWRMLFNDYDNIEQGEYGVNLLFALKNCKPKDWNSDWRNESLLGVACDKTYRYNARYEAFKSAHERALTVGEGDHPGLLISIARCCDAPGKSVISYQDSLQLVLRAIENKIYLDGAWALSGIYSSIGDENKHKYWKAAAEKLESEKGVISPHVYPQFLWEEEICTK